MFLNKEETEEDTNFVLLFCFPAVPWRSMSGAPVAQKRLPRFPFCSSHVVPRPQYVHLMMLLGSEMLTHGSVPDSWSLINNREQGCPFITACDLGSPGLSDLHSARPLPPSSPVSVVFLWCFSSSPCVLALCVLTKHWVFYFKPLAVFPVHSPIVCPS